MKKLLLIFFGLIPIALFSQVDLNLKGVVNKKINGAIREGDSVELRSLITDEYFNISAILIHQEKTVMVDYKQLDRVDFRTENIDEFWKVECLHKSIYEYALKKGMQYELRKELIEESLQYLSYAENNDLFYHDSYLETYLFSLAYKICPDRLLDGRSGVLGVRILKDLNPDLFILPNGTMCIGTGLLATLQSEEELMAIMASEISHYLFDHYLVNINKAATRQKRAEFWAAFATGVAAATDIYLASENRYYTPGGLTMGIGILAFSLAESVNDRFGGPYTYEQIFEADRSAVTLMDFIKSDSKALSSALKRIRNYHSLNGNYYQLMSNINRPGFDERISALLGGAEFNNSHYDVKFSSVISFNAILEFNNNHYLSCQNLLDRNMAVGVATEEDYILNAMLLMRKTNTEATNTRALQYIETAEKLNITPNINLQKQKALVLIRLNKKEEARKSLEEYKKLLLQENSKITGIDNPGPLSFGSSYIRQEFEWTQKMLLKIDKL